MKRILIALVTSMAVLLLPLHALAGKGGEKGPGDRAYERANDNASFKRGGHDDDYDRHQHRVNQFDLTSCGRFSQRLQQESAGEAVLADDIFHNNRNRFYTG